MNRSSSRQQGAALVEALVAFLILGLGLVAIVRGQGELRTHAEQARQRAEAVRLAQADIERARAGDYAGIADDSRSIAADGGWAASAAYTLERTVGPATLPHARQLVVSVRWTDSRGQAQRVALATIVADADPALGALLALPR